MQPVIEVRISIYDAANPADRAQKTTALSIQSVDQYSAGAAEELVASEARLAYKAVRKVWDEHK